MSRLMVQRLGWWSMILVTVGGGVAAWLISRSVGVDDTVVFGFYGYAVVGAVVAARRPDNALGWIFLFVGVLTSTAGLAHAAGVRAFAGGLPYPWWGVWGAWYNSWFWVPLFLLSTTFTFLLFPTGLASPRWRPVLWLGVTATLSATVFSGLAPTVELTVAPGTDDIVMIDSPLAAILPTGVSFGVNSPWVGLPFLIGLLCGLAAIVSVAIRTWRSTGVERLQMRMFAFTVLLFPIHAFLSESVDSFGNSDVGSFTFTAVLILIPISCGLAILRYHLYDIDRIIGRTTAYALVSGVLLAVYVTVVTGVGQLLPKSSALAVAAATLAAAGAFRPVWGSVQSLVNRRFNREQYDAERSVEEFAVRLRHEVDSVAVRDDLLAVLDRTVQPAASGLWLREASS